MINKAAADGLWKGIKFGSQGPELSHLLFAYDSLLFLEAYVESCEVATQILKSYEEISRQAINLHKCSLYFSKHVPQTVQDEICTRMSISKGDGKGKYLGLPYMTRRSKKEIFSHVREKVWKRLHDWKEKLLSPGGREVLIKSVIQAIPMYVMQCFLLPKSVINSITSMVRRFFWGGSNTSRKITWRSWEVCCRPKEMGGLGFRDLKLFNKALISKQVWIVLQHPTSLVGQNTIRSTAFLMLGRDQGHLFFWRSLIEGRDFVNMGLRWSIRDGQKVRVFEDPWIPLEPHFKPVYGNNLLSHDTTVNSLVLSGQRAWNSTLIRNEFLDFEAERIFEIPLPSSQSADKIIWHYDRRGIYSVKSGYLVGLNRKLQQVNNPQNLAASSSRSKGSVWSLVWNLPLQPRVQHFLWKALHNCLPTSTNLHRRGLSDGICSICGVEPESLDHCLLTCAIPRAVAAYSPDVAKWFVCRHDSFGGLIRTLKEKDGVEGACRQAYLLWHIWKARCGWIFEEHAIYIGRLCHEAFTNAAEYYGMITKETEVPRTSATREIWVKPQEGYAKINVDGSIKDNTAAIGILVRKSDGSIICAVSQHVNHSRNPEAVELTAIKEGLVLAHNLGLACIEIESDSLLAISRLQSSDQDLSDLGTVAWDVCRLASLFSDVIFMYAKRVCNTPAHLLAQHGLGSSSFIQWGTTPPVNVLAAAAADLT